MSKKINLLLGFVLLFLMIFIFSFGLSKLITIFADLNDNSKAAVLIAFITVVPSVFAVVYGRIKDRQLQINALQQDKHESIATQFMKGLWGVVHEELADDEEKIKELFQSIMINGTLWFSDATLKKFVIWRELSQANVDGNENLKAIADLILALRKDLGHKNKNISQKDILSVFVNDLDENFLKEK